MNSNRNFHEEKLIKQNSIVNSDYDEDDTDDTDEIDKILDVITKLENKKFSRKILGIYYNSRLKDICKDENEYHKKVVANAG